jgi:hypothetical protein
MSLEGEPLDATTPLPTGTITFRCRTSAGEVKVVQGFSRRFFGAIIFTCDRQSEDPGARRERGSPDGCPSMTMTKVWHYSKKWRGRTAAVPSL